MRYGKRYLIGLLVGLAGYQAAHGAISDAELQDAMGNVAGLNWMIDNPFQWTRTYDSYNLWPPGYRLILTASGSSGPSRFLAGHVEGPGILELDRQASLNHSGTVLVNGVQDGGRVPDRDFTDRVFVPAGSHEIRWLFAPTTGFAQTVFGRPRWQPGIEMPLSAGEGDGSVTLSGAGWRGLDGWSEGDGGVAWSGLIHSAPDATGVVSTVLKGDTTGAGVVRFRYQARGKEGRVRVDGGAWQSLPFKDKWATGFIPVQGNGPHTVEWEASSVVDARRVTSDLALNDVKRVAEVDYATALDCPELTVVETPLNVTRPVGAEMEGTRGGAGVVVNYRSGLNITLTERSLVKIRETGGGGFHGGTLSNPWGGWLQSDVLSTETRPDGQWVIRCYILPAGTHTLGAYAEARVDYIEIVPKPEGLSELLGLPEGSFTTGGDVPWTIAPVSHDGQYEAIAYIHEGGNNTWLEHQVTGPAEISVRYLHHNEEPNFKILVDGKRVWDSSLRQEANKARLVSLEIPEGQHTVRYLAERPATYYSSNSLYVCLAGISVSALPPGGKICEALDAGISSGRSGTWEIAPGAGMDGGDALRAVSPKTSYGEPVLKMPFTGPGLLRYHTKFTGTSYYSYLTMRPSFAPVFSRQYSAGNPGWMEHVIWVPPGEHWMNWEPNGDAAQVSAMLIDQMSFSPDQLATVEEVLGTEGLAWESVPSSEPWKGVLRNGGAEPGVISPLMGRDQKRLAVEVTGPGMVSFKWKRTGNVTGAFYVDGVKKSPTLAGNAEEAESLFIAKIGPVRLEWEGASASDQTGWLELKEFQWQPWIEGPLDESLDAEGLTWTTSPDMPVTGRPTPGAVGGMAANVVLSGGEQSWLETTVDGPGVFGFSVLPSSVNSPTYPGHIPVGVNLLIDGRYVNSFGAGSQDLLILGDGPHTVRFEFQGYWGGAEIKGVAIDNVSWLPRAGTNVGDGWTSNVPEAIGKFPGIGEDGAEGIALLPMMNEGRWIEKEVTGPGLLTWREKNSIGNGVVSHQNLMVDGVTIGLTLGFFGEWDTYALHVPEGRHRVRWFLKVSPQDPGLPDGEDIELAMVAISGMTFVPGITPLMEGVDHASSVWLENGPDAGKFVTSGEAYDGEDKWSPGEVSFLYLINPTDHWIHASSKINGSANAAPILRKMFVPPASLVFWNGYVDSNWNVTSLVDGFSSSDVGDVPLAEAVDHAAVFESSGWQGGSFDESGTNLPEDAAWSVSPSPDTKLSTVIEGPAKVRFRWRCDAGTKLVAGIDGRQTPIPAAGTGWSEAELWVDQGSHVVSWHHQPDEAGYVPYNESAAWVDALRVEALPVRSPEAVVMAAGEVTPVLEGGTEWMASYYHEAGEWKEAITARSGESVLKATVSGPNIVSFNAWISVPPPLLESGSTPETSGGTAVIEPNFHSYAIQVRIGDETVMETLAFSGAQLPAIRVPPGEHEITWRLVKILYDEEWNLHSYPVSGDPGFGVWLGDLRRTSPEAHFADWKVRHGLSGELSGADGDADQDGLPDLMEYAYGTDPRDRYSMVSGIWSWVEPSPVAERSDDPETGDRFYLILDSALPHVEADLEESTDMKTWRKVRSVTNHSFTSMLSAQIMSFPIDQENTTRFFRIRVAVPGQ